MQSVLSTQGFPKLGPSDFAFSDTLSYSSYSSGTTIWGPGTLAGKFVLSLGKATLRTAENLVIFHRIAAISRQVPFRDDDDLIDIETMCDDIVELIRPELYSRRYRMKGLELVVRQLAAQQTLHLAAALSKLHFHDLVNVLTELMIICMLPDTNTLHPKISHKYSELLRESSVDPSLPCVNLFAQIAQQHRVGFTAVLETGFLEVFLWTCLRFMVNLEGSLIPSTFSWAINVFSYPPEDLGEAWMTKIHRVVSFETTNTPLLVQVLDTLYDRKRLKNMGECEKARLSSDSFRDIDLLPFCSISHIWDQSSSLPYRGCSVLNVSSACNECSKTQRTSHLFIQSILVGGEMKQTISSFLSRQSHKVKLSIFLRTFCILLKGLDTNEEIDSLSLMFNQSASKNSALVVELLIEFVSYCREWWEAMIDAALLAILPFIKSDMKAYKISDDIIYRTWHGCWRRTLPPAYSSYTTKFLASIRANGLRQVLKTRDPDINNELCNILDPVFRAHRMSLFFP